MLSVMQQQQKQMQNNPNFVGTANFPNNINNPSAIYQSENSMAQGIFHQKTNSGYGGLSGIYSAGGIGSTKGIQPHSLASYYYNNSVLTPQQIQFLLKSHNIDSSKTNVSGNGGNQVNVNSLHSQSMINNNMNMASSSGQNPGGSSSTYQGMSMFGPSNLSLINNQAGQFP